MQPSPIRTFANPALGSIALRHQPQLLRADHRRRRSTEVITSTRS